MYELFVPQEIGTEGTPIVGKLYAVRKRVLTVVLHFAVVGHRACIDAVFADRLHHAEINLGLGMGDSGELFRLFHRVAQSGCVIARRLRVELTTCQAWRNAHIVSESTLAQYNGDSRNIQRAALGRGRLTQVSRDQVVRRVGSRRLVSAGVSAVATADTQHRMSSRQ